MLLIIAIHTTEPKMESAVLNTVGEHSKAVHVYGDGIVGWGIGTDNVLCYYTLDGYVYMPHAIHCISTFPV